MVVRNRGPMLVRADSRSWIAEERFSLLEDDGGEGGIFVIRGGWW